MIMGRAASLLIFRDDNVKIAPAPNPGMAKSMFRASSRCPQSANVINGVDMHSATPAWTQK